MPTAKRVHEFARTKEPLPILRFSSVPPLFTELAVYSICTLAAGGEHFRNSPTVWTERFKAMLGASISTSWRRAEADLLLFLTF